MTSKFTNLRSPTTVFVPIFLLSAALLANEVLAKEDVAKATDDNQCVFSRTVNDWRALDSRNMVIWTPGRKDAYLVTLSFPLHNLRSEENVAIVDSNGDGRLCGFGMDQVVTASGAFTERATITGMEHLDEAGLAALSEQYKVKLLPSKKDSRE